MTATRQISEMTDTEARETYRKVMVNALTNQAERYRAKAQSYADAAVAKPGSGLEAGVEEYLGLAAYAEQVRDQIKEA